MLLWWLLSVRMNVNEKGSAASHRIITSYRLLDTLGKASVHTSYVLYRSSISERVTKVSHLPLSLVSRAVTNSCSESDCTQSIGISNEEKKKELYAQWAWKASTFLFRVSSKAGPSSSKGNGKPKLYTYYIPRSENKLKNWCTSIAALPRPIECQNVS